MSIPLPSRSRLLQHLLVLLTALTACIAVPGIGRTTAYAGAPAPTPPTLPHLTGCPGFGGGRVLMVDSAFAPDAAQAQAMLTGQGVHIWAGYLSSPSTFNPWSATDFSAVRSAGMAAVPIWVAPYGGMTVTGGLRDAATAVQQARGDGFAAGPLVLDVEPEAWNADPGGTLRYAAAWAALVRHSGYSAWAYGISDFLDGLAGDGDAQRFDAVWIAWYDTSTWEMPDPHAALSRAGAAWQHPGQRLRQWFDTVTLPAVPDVAVDLSAADGGVTTWMRAGSNC